MKYLSLVIAIVVCLSGSLFAQQKDTVYVPGFYESGGVSPDNYGTLNDAVDAARNAGTINNTVFKLTSYDVYVLTKTLFIYLDENLEIVAPKPLRAGDADEQTVRESAPPQIVWDESVPSPDADDYIIQTYGDLVLKNIWVRYADFLGVQRSSSITFIDTVAAGGEPDTEQGYFDGCLFDYCPIGTEAGGAITVDADHFTGIFKNCYFRNLTDNHFQYYGRAISFPYQSTGYHYDYLLFENCTFSNLSRIVMQEGNEYGDKVHFNHCTLINSVEWVYQTGRFSNEGWLKECSITNSIFVNPCMFGFRVLDLLDTLQTYQDWLDGKVAPPGNGGLISQIQPVDSFGFVVDWTDYDRKLFVGNNVYMTQDWLKSWYENCPWAKDQIQNRHPEEVYHPSPMLSEGEMAFIDSVDGEGHKVFPNMNVDESTIYDTDPDFIVPPTNVDTLKLFMEGKWGTGLDINWSYQPGAGFAQKWPLPDNLTYNNAAYQTAAMGGFPLGDLNWFPDKLADWEAQRDDEWQTINDSLNRITAIREIPGFLPGDYVLKQNYPNPFNPTTTIEYSIPVSGKVSLKVYNTLGQEIVTLYNGIQRAGTYQATFNGSGLASGVYTYQLRSGNISITRKFVLMK